jgi:hypothetical protein
MTNAIHSVSLNKEQEDFLKENPSFSPSKLLQQSINALMQSYNKGDLTELIENEKLKNTQNCEIIKAMVDFINKKGLMDEWIKEPFNQPKEE